jgi:ferritin-like metal-binding protein YciE
MTTKTLNDLFIHSLSDVYSAEKQMTKSLPKMAKASTHSGLRSAFWARRSAERCSGPCGL